MLHFVVIVFAFSFLGGAFFSDVEKSLVSIGLSMVAGAVITLVLFLLPLLAYGQTWEINVIIDQAIGFIAMHLLFGSISAIMGAMLGSFILSGALR